MTDTENLISQEKEAKPQTAKKKNRKRGKTLREAAQTLLSAPLPEDDPIMEALTALGVKHPTGADAVMAAQYIKAAQGDAKAAQFLRDAGGEELITGPEKDDKSMDLSKLSDDELRQLAAHWAKE